MGKKNTGLVIIIIILSILVVALSGYVVYDKLLNSANNIINNENNVNDNGEKDNNLSDNYIQNIKNGYWYNNGTIFFIGENKFSIGKYASDGGYVGIVSIFEEFSDKYKLIAISDACIDVGCMNPTNGYTLDIEMKYHKNSELDEVTIISIIKTEDGNSEHLSGLEKTYQFAGNNWEEVEEYVNNLRGTN